MTPPRGPTLRLVCVNDVYTLENFPRLKSLIEHHRRTDPADAFLVTLAGDFVGPSILSGLDSGRGIVDCMNALGVTHVTFGNHENDITVGELLQRVQELEATWLATNVRGDDPRLPAYQVVQVGAGDARRVRVGLLGVVTDDAGVYGRPLFPGFAITPANPAALAEAAWLLRDERCDAVIPLTHQALAEDRALAEAQREPPFPVIVGGHEHDVHLEQVSGTWIVKAGADAIHAVVVDLAWPDAAPAPGARDLPEVRVRLEDVASYPEDPALRARVDGHMARVHGIDTATLLRLAPGQVLSSIGTRVRQTSMGTLVCSRVRDAFGAEGCLFNGGGIRASREYEGHLTYGDVKAELPFDNVVVVATLPGRVVRDAVAASRVHAPAEDGGFLQVDDGMRAEGEVTAIAGAPLILDREYRIAIVRELLTGMNHIEPLVRYSREHPDKVPPALSGREIKVALVEAFSVALWKELGGFDAVDADHDGIVTEPELEAAIARAQSEPPSPVVADLVLQALDGDHDQRVSRREAMAVEKAKE